MNPFFAALLSAAIILALSGCGDEIPASPLPAAPVPPASLSDTPEPSAEHERTDGATLVFLQIGTQTFTATLNDSASARALAAQLPLTLELSDLHGNEKYYYLDKGLPTDSQRPGRIQAGDLMLYGSDCLVLFYESFDSTFSYTRLGSVDNPAELAAAVGAGGVTITFEVQ